MFRKFFSTFPASIFAVILLLSFSATAVYAGFTYYSPGTPKQSVNSHEMINWDEKWYWPLDPPPAGQEIITAKFDGDPASFVAWAMCSVCATNYCVNYKDTTVSTETTEITK